MKDVEIDAAAGAEKVKCPISGDKYRELNTRKKFNLSLYSYHSLSLISVNFVIYILY